MSEFSSGRRLVARHDNFYRYFDPAVGRYLSADPIGQLGGVNLYGYVRNNPLRFIDPFGLETTVLTIRDFGVGTHSALHVDDGGSGPLLYDPAGSYVPPSGEHRGSGDTFGDDDASVDAYRRYWEARGSTVEETVLPTSAAEERAIADRIEALGGGTGGMCTAAVSAALGGTCGIGSFWLPGSLADAARKAAQSGQCREAR